MEIPVDPNTGQQVEPFDSAVTRVWMAEDPNAKFGEFGENNLEGYIKAIEMLVQHLASQTRTPPHYFYLSGQFPSGESIKSAETGLVAKVKDKQIHFGEALEEIIRIGFKIKRDDARAAAIAMETIWADCESRSDAELADALLKLQAIGVPQEALWEKAQFSQTEIVRFKEMRAEQPTPVLPVKLVAPTEPAAADPAA